MKVGFDISQIAHRGGVGTYTKELARNLVTQKDLEMVFFYSSLRQSLQEKLPNIKRLPLPPTIFEPLFNQFRLVKIESLIGRVDVFHSSDWTQPPTNAKKVTTYHDVVPIKYPQWSHPKVVDVQRRRLKLVETEIDLVITVSEATKKDLIEVSRIPKEKIVVIYEGVGEQFKKLSPERIAEFKKKYKLPEKFVLSIGGVGERRNLDRAKMASQNYLQIITGKDVWVSEEEMPLLYNSAAVLFYPSLYEGFGLPIIEAMACGTPVITSNVSAMPEIAGDAALLVDPENTDSMRKALKSVMEDDGLRARLSKQGSNRAKDFSWKKAALETAAVYKKAVSS